MSRPALVALFVVSLLLALCLQLLKLPDAVAPFMPLLLAMTLTYWALFSPNFPVLFLAFLLGLISDVLAAAPLGQHAVGLVLIAYAGVQLRVNFGRSGPVQQALSLLPLFLVYCLLMFWMDGMARHPSAAWARFAPAFTSAALWPLLCAGLNALGGRDDR